ncbi:16S rRNA (guanine(966)-N(2))-methyltransferase RsmD [Halomonas halocynthiae]|uniref:16S rRNA (guanine(966)-N(2))-methyltransferase RsmD n=1 Tax=Halomonas halocynthiae TaxID=176290 RepID=UPI000401C25E|nr:16S rRNA (guanine(966)-N(2))-methyltransferase RsmD [Halomonas halocynthiae]
MTRKHLAKNRTRRSHKPPAATPASATRGRLRIIGGEFRRRLLPVINHPGLRPTPDRVRETLFNWLGTSAPGARVLDLFAGTGALGLEALSRGATQTLLVESDVKVANALMSNLATLGIAKQRADVINTDALSFLAGPPQTFDMVFLDPPFRQGLAASCCLALANDWLADEAWIYVETESDLLLDTPNDWTLHRETQAGDSHGRLYRRY